MYSRPDDWTFYNKQMCKAMKIKSEETLRKYVKQLVEFGWLDVTQLREKGVFKENQYTIYQQSSNKKYNTVEDSPYPKKTDTEKNRHGKNIVHNNTNSLNNTNNKTNTKNNVQNEFEQEFERGVNNIYGERLPDISKTINETSCLNEKSKEEKEKSCAKKEKINEDFEKWWNTYGKKVGRHPASLKWNKLKDEERQKCLDSVSGFVKSNPDKQYRPNPATYLNQKRFLDEILTENKVNNATPVKKARSLFDVLNRKTQ